MWSVQYSLSFQRNANPVYKWKERSHTCPQCRGALSKEEPFLRDYILERITEKYAKVKLAPEELLEREILATLPPP